VATLACAVACSACAVLTVDVDVYKGPLANERDLQLNQAAVLAVAAKPLLLEFRNDQERKHAKGDDRTRFESLVAGAGSGSITGYTFSSPEAGRANAVLSLYEDQAPNQLIAQILSDVTVSINDYADAFRIFRPERGSLAWTTRTKLLRELGVDIDYDDEDQDDAGRLTVRAPDANATVTATDAAAGTAKDVAARNAAAAAAGATTEAAIAEAEEQLRRAYVEMLLPRHLDARVPWIFYEQEMARSYASLAGARTSLDTPSRARFVDTKDADVRFRILAEDPRLIVEDALRLFPGQHASARTRFVEETKSVAQAFGDARAAIERLLVLAFALDDALADTPGLDKAEIKKARETIARYLPWLVSKAALQSTIGREVDSSEVNSDNLEQTIQGLQSTHRAARDAGKDHGIAAGPMENPEAIDVDEILSSFEDLARILGGGLERGRPELGLESLIERFLVAQEKGSQSDEDEAFDRLSNAMVQFAEKTLFLAQNAILLPTSSDAKDNAAILEKLGNSIIVQLNELNAWHTHHAKSAQDGARRRRAEDRSDQDTVYDNDPTPDEIASATGVLDEVIADLEAKHRGALEAGDTPKARNIGAALDAAYAQRVRLVYIRPPSFYVKNSYPVSSLQAGTSAVGWKNELGRHGMRSVPFLGEAYANPSPRQQRIQSLLDRQFWQNINRIRVAGAGNTNYVLAKDDVGNWYVRNFSADPTPIINAAKGAAMLAMGAPPIGAAVDTPSLNLRGSRTLIDRQTLHFRTQYEERTSQDRERIAAFVGTGDSGLGARIMTRLSADAAITAVPKAPGGLQETLQNSAAKIPSLPANAADTETAAEAITQTLIGLRRFAEDARGAVAAAYAPKPAEPGTSTPGITEADRVRALQIVKEEVTIPLQRIVEDRWRTVDEYQSALSMLLASVTGPEPAPSTQAAPLP
jgi:hypothetical protein